MITGALFSDWRWENQNTKALPKPNPLKPRTRRTAPKENTMKKRIALVVLLACGLTATALLNGCGTFGNGRIDLPFDIDVALVTEDGRTFHIHQTAQGLDIEGEFVEPKTGIVFILGEGVGNITARDPKTGLQVTLSPKGSPAEAGTTNPESANASKIDQAPPGT
jgi:hypothetical protein